MRLGNEMVGCKLAIAGMVGALTICAASGATRYVVPWYVNPTLQARIYTGADDLRVVDLRLDSAGERLLMTAENGYPTTNVQVFALGDATNLTKVATNAWHESQSATLGSAPYAAVAPGEDAFYAI